MAKASSHTMSAYMARGIQAIASLSATYGTTDEDTPTQAPAASGQRDRIGERRIMPFGNA